MQTDVSVSPDYVQQVFEHPALKLLACHSQSSAQTSHNLPAGAEDRTKHVRLTQDRGTAACSREQLGKLNVVSERKKLTCSSTLEIALE